MSGESNLNRGLRFAVGTSDDRLVIKFAEPVAWIALDRGDALRLAKVINSLADDMPEATEHDEEIA